MNKRTFYLICILAFTVFMSSVASVFGQEIDVNSMDNEQLTAVLLEVLSKLQQQDDTATETDQEMMDPVTTAVPSTLAPVVDPGPIEEIIQIKIYENKKLIIEALPGYLFIQPTKESRITEQDPQDPDTGINEPGPVPGTPCDPDFPNFCFWTLRNGEVVCVCSELG